MFKWLRDKMLKGSEEEFNKGLDRNTNFLEFAKSFSNNTPEVNDIIHALETDNMMLWTARIIKPKPSHAITSLSLLKNPFITYAPFLHCQRQALPPIRPCHDL